MYVIDSWNANSETVHTSTFIYILNETGYRMRMYLYLCVCVFFLLYFEL